MGQTLNSLVSQVTDVRFAVVVIENEALKREGAAVARSYFDAALLNGVCFVEIRQGNCFAINRAFGEGRTRFPCAKFFLMIDDDEVADPNWLDTMVSQARAQDADIVGGPVTPRFPENAPAKMLRHPVYWSTFDRTGFVPMIYGSGNCLIHRRIFERLEDPDFDIRFNFLGGGDTEFFTRCRKIGARFFWTQEAKISETVSADRLKQSWILKRSLRIGAINYQIDRKNGTSTLNRLRLVAKNCALVPIACLRATQLALCAKPVLVVLHPLVIVAGRLLAVVGLQPEQYRAKPSES